MDFLSRISLRPTKLSDVDDFLTWSSDERVTRHTRWDALKSKEQALSHIENVVTRHPWYKMICLDGRSVGFLSVSPEPIGGGGFRAHVSYAVAADHWGRGIATAALRMAVAFAFRELEGLVRLETMVEPENVASQRVLEKVGFLREGLMRKYAFCKGDIKDVLVYSFLNTDEIREPSSGDKSACSMK